MLVSKTSRTISSGVASNAPKQADAGVVDDDVESAERGYALADRRVDRRVVGDVEPELAKPLGLQVGASRVRRIVELIAEETGAHRPGRDLILERLVEVLLVEALRFRPASAAASSTGSSRASPIPRSRARYGECTKTWRIDGRSRSSRAQPACRAQCSPNDSTARSECRRWSNLLEWRIAIAKDALCREHPPLAELAERIGYQSASAFSTAFTRHAGCAPSAFARLGSEPDHRERRGNVE